MFFAEPKSQYLDAKNNIEFDQYNMLIFSRLRQDI
tara:strand:+ start:534 stop:638 length:105 start_codon:yes stop_codon:yes gene_type:complete